MKDKQEHPLEGTPGVWRGARFVHISSRTVNGSLCMKFKVDSHSCQALRLKSNKKKKLSDTIKYDPGSGAHQLLL